MGYIRHDIVFVHFDREYSQGGKEAAEALSALREEMGEPWGSLLVGPIYPIANGGEHWLFLPDGSKEGWGTSAQGDKWRERFMQAASLVEWPSAMRVQWGDDDPKVTWYSDALRDPATTGWDTVTKG